MHLFKTVLSFGMLVLMVSLAGCNADKKMSSLLYFKQQGDTLAAKKVQDYEPKIQPGDRLSIIVNALDPASVAPFNLGASATASTATGAPISGYTVEGDGTILLPQLGRISVLGFHRKQLIDTLTARISRYVADPVVTIQFLNFRITILGEVSRQGTFNIPDGRVTLLEAMGLAGDMTMYARRDNILVVREQGGKREFGRINLLTKDAFSSPYFVLQQNDVVYIEFTKFKVTNSDQTTLRTVSLVTTLFSVTSALTLFLINILK